jgi:hypothetical protein
MDAVALASSWRAGVGADVFSGEERGLFDLHEFTAFHVAVFVAVRAARNLPDVPPRELVWATAVASLGSAHGDQDRVAKLVEERVRLLGEADRRFGWLCGEWTPKLMTRLVKTWYCGLMVVDPNLAAKTGAPMQWTHEYYGDEHYPGPEGQTDEWKEESVRFFALMTRSILRAYPMAATKGIVSFSDMVDFDWSKYDMDTKRRNADVTSLVPLKFVRMISVRPDEKMLGFFDEMGPRALKKWGFAAYENFERAVAGESELLCDEIPTFVGGKYRLDVLACLRALFRTEPEALQLCERVHEELRSSGQLPCPAHMA